MQILLLLTLLVNCVLCLRQSVHTDKSLLIVYDSAITELSEYSRLQSDLKNKDYHINTIDISEDDAQLKIFENSERAYQNLILFPLKTKNLGGEVSASAFLEFMNDGGNIFAITSPSGVQDDEKVFLNELGIFPSPAGYKTVDHFNFEQKLGKASHDVLALDQSPIKNTKIASAAANEIVYSGSAALLSNNQLLVPVLQAPTTAYTTKEDDVYVSGQQGYFAVGFQSRKNSRAMWIGSELLLSDKLYSVNEPFVSDIIDWTFGAKSVIKSTSVEHYLAAGNVTDQIYKIKDEIVYNIGLTEWNGSQWVPFEGDDVQVEVRMLDPYYRITMTPAEIKDDAQIYTTGAFSLPDQHGMFTLYTNYKRDGLSFVESKNVVTVRHLANNEYQRSWDIPNSWVYVASNFTVALSFLVFVVMFLYKR